MDIKIGNKKVVNYSAVIAIESEPVVIEYMLNEFLQRYIIIVKSDENKKNSDDILIKDIEFSGGENEMKITFINWGRSMRGDAIKPLEIGSSKDGEKLFLLVCIKKFNQVYKLDIQTMLEVDDASK